MQYKVPQNVDIEDRVIGPLTLRQFMILLIGASAIIILYFIFVGPFRIFFWLFALLIGGVAGSFAFAKYGDQKMEIFILSALKTFTTPRRRIWKKEEEVPQMVKKNPGKKEANSEGDNIMPTSKNDLENLAQLVDSGGYSRVDSKDRIMPAENPQIDDSGAQDIRESSESLNTEIEKIAKESKSSPQKKEPLVSDEASVNPNKKFDYPKIELTDDKFYENLK